MTWVHGSRAFTANPRFWGREEFYFMHNSYSTILQNSWTTPCSLLYIDWVQWKDAEIKKHFTFDELCSKQVHLYHGSIHWIHSNKKSLFQNFEVQISFSKCGFKVGCDLKQINFFLKKSYSRDLRPVPIPLLGKVRRFHDSNYIWPI